MNADTLPTTLPLTIAGETREVAVAPCGDGRLVTVADVALAQVGRTGHALWATRVTFWRQTDGSYRADLTTSRIRKPARIVAWNSSDLSDHLSKR